MENIAHKTVKSKHFWLSLDNAAKIFPATVNEETTTVFRLTVALKEPVNIKALMIAVSKAEKRFPYYKVHLKKGFFWYYLQHINQKFPVVPDKKLPCRKFSDKGLMVRILAAENRLSVEFAHVLTDGGGGFEFLKTILLLYAEAKGKTIPEDFNYLKPEDDISEEEYEDAYKRYFKEEIPPMLKRSTAFHLPCALDQKPRFKITRIKLSISDLKALADVKNVSITDYLVAIYLYSLQEIYEETHSFNRHKKNKVLRVQVPVNLRNIFPSATMRNFSLFVMPEIDLRLGHYTFNEILRRVYHQIRLETDEKLINKNIARNVGSEKKVYVKSIPLFLKSLILKLKHKSLGTSQYSGVITNLGKVKLPKEVEEICDHFVFTPPPPNSLLKVNCGIIGFEDTLIMSFGNVTKSTILERKFYKFLQDQGVEAEIENCEES